MLKVEKLDVYYGNIRALHEVSFEVKQGEIVTLIGANGAGKTTVLHAISGLVPARSGSIRFLDQELTALAPINCAVGFGARAGRKKDFCQSYRKENLEMGAYTRKDAKAVKADYEQVFTRFPLEGAPQPDGGTLSGGEQQMLAIGRTLMSRPKRVLMDEPSMGLAPLLVSEIFEIIKEINAAGTTILLVEQNAQMALSIADRAYVLETGRVVLQGEAQALANSEEVRKAYLGG